MPQTINVDDDQTDQAQSKRDCEESGDISGQHRKRLRPDSGDGTLREGELVEGLQTSPSSESTDYQDAVSTPQSLHVDTEDQTGRYLPYAELGKVDNKLPDNTFISDYIIGDGNCLFRALAQLELGNQNRHGVIRKACAAFLEKNIDIVKKTIMDDSETDALARAYLKEQARHGEFGEDCMVVAFVHLFKKPVTIYMKGYDRDGNAVDNVTVNCLMPAGCDVSLLPGYRLFLDMKPNAPHFELVLDNPPLGEGERSSQASSSVPSTISHVPEPSQALEPLPSPSPEPLQSATAPASFQTTSVSDSRSDEPTLILDDEGLPRVADAEPESWNADGAATAGVSDALEDDDELDDTDDLPQQANTKRQRRESREDPISLYLVRILKKLQKHNYNKQLEDGLLWLDPGNPTSKAASAFFLTGIFHPEYYYYPKCFVWAPHISFPEVKLSCPKCMQFSKPKNHGWTDFPRRVYGLDSSYYIYAFKYQCNCGHIFRSTSKEVIRRLPEHISLQFPALLTKRSGVDLDLLFKVRSGIGKGVNPNVAFDMTRQAYTRRHSILELQYLRMAEYCRDEIRVQSRVCVSTKTVKVPMFSDFRDHNGFRGQYPSANFLSKLFVQEINNMRGYLDFEVQRRDGVVLAVDHYFKRFNETRTKYGMPPIKVVYIDNCCQERAFYEREIPELTKNIRTLKLLPIPACNRIMKLDGTNANQIRMALHPWLTIARSGKPLPIGVDTEWNYDPANPRGPPGKLKLLQIAMTEKLDGCEQPQDNMEALPESLIELLWTRPNVLKVGRSVGNDLQLLARDFSRQHLRNRRSRQRVEGVGELAQLAKLKGVISDGRKGALKDLTEKVLGYTLDKYYQEGVDWSRPSREALIYAARDAWASLLVHLALIEMPNRDFSPPSTTSSSASATSAISASSSNSSVIQLALERRARDEDRLAHDHHHEEWHDLELQESPQSAPSADREIQMLLSHPESRVLLDCFHAMKRAEGPRLHPAAPLLSSSLRKVLLIENAIDKGNVERTLIQKYNITYAQKLLSDPDYVFKRIRRACPQPDILVPALKNLVVEFSKESYNDNEGKPLMTAELRKAFENLIKHAEKGCLSDPPGVALYRPNGLDQDKLQKYICFRGTNSVESLHQTLESMFSTFNAGIDLADCIMAYLRHVLNIGASERNRSNFPTIGHHDHFLIDKINRVSKELCGTPKYIWWARLEPYATHETFGITPSVPPSQYQEITPDDLKNYPPFYACLVTRMKEKVPKLPIHTPSERKLFHLNINFYSLPTLENRRTGFDSKRMCADWNGGTLEASCGVSYPAVSREHQIFKKTPEQLEDYFKAIATKDMFAKNKDELQALEDFNEFMREDYFHTFDLAEPRGLDDYRGDNAAVHEELENSNFAAAHEDFASRDNSEVMDDIQPPGRAGSGGSFRSTTVNLQSLGIRELICQTCKIDSCP
ncbi:hypothetical protein HDU97_006913, partial [Phlyctochytrium planicorne]